MFIHNFKVNIDNHTEANELASCIQPFFYKVDIKVYKVENNWLLSLSTEEFNKTKRLPF